MVMESDPNLQDPGNSDPGNSGGSGDQPPSAPDIADTVKNVVEEILPGLLQSQKDRRINKLERTAGETFDRLTRIEQLIDGGMNFTQAKKQAEQEERNIAIDQLLAEREPKTVSEPVSDFSGVINSIFQANGISLDDPRVKQFLSKETGADAITKAVNLAVEIKQSTGASPVTVQTLSKGSPAYKSLLDKYNEEKQRILNDPRHGRGSPELISLKIKYRKQGLDIF